MSPLTEKLFAIALALMLGLSPLQGAIAAAVSSAHAGGHPEAAFVQTLDDTATMAASDSDHECERCMFDGCCNGASCASMQCASCVGATLSSYPAANAQSAVSLMSSYNHGVLTNTVASLYRPPRA